MLLAATDTNDETVGREVSPIPHNENATFVCTTVEKTRHFRVIYQVRIFCNFTKDSIAQQFVTKSD
jgi:hypothetical protein